MNVKAVVLMSALAAALLAAAPVARADCCYTTGYNDKCEIACKLLRLPLSHATHASQLHMLHDLLDTVWWRLIGWAEHT